MNAAKRLLATYYIAFFAVIVLGKLIGSQFFAGLSWFSIFLIGLMPPIAMVGIGFMIFLFLCVWYLINDRSKWEE